MSNGQGESEHIREVAVKVHNILEPLCDKIEIVGSIRRKKSEVHDVDLILIPKDRSVVAINMAALGTKEGGGNKKEHWLVDGVQVELYYAEASTWGGFMLMYTGSKEYNITMRIKAKGLGLMLNQYGLYRGMTRIASEKEEDIFEKLGMPYVPPEGR